MANVSSFSGAMPVIPGGEVAVAEVTRTTNYTTASTTVSGAADVFSSHLTFIADGTSTYIVEFLCSSVLAAKDSAAFVQANLVNGSGTAIAVLGYVGYGNGGTYGSFGDYSVRYPYVPSAGTVTLNVRAVHGAAAGTLYAGAGTGGGNIPMYLRVSRVVNQNDGLKPFWTPPVVTSLPSQATEGDQVLLYSSSPYAGYQTHQYVTGSWRTLDDSRGTGAWQSWTPAMTQTGALTFTTTRAKYVVIGKTVTAQFNLTGFSGGTNAAAITMTYGALPTPASGVSVYGSFRWFDAGNTNYAGTIIGDSSGMSFYQDGNGNPLGGGALSSASDVFQGQFTYEAA